MKNTILKSIVILTFLFVSGTLFSQDSIYVLGSEVIECNIVSISDEAISYVTDDTGDINFSINTSRVKKVHFSSGRVMVFNDEVTGHSSVANYGGNKKSAFKVDMFAPFLGVFAVGYERSLKPGKSVEFELGFIGLGVNIDNQNASGCSLKGGYKLISKRVKQGKTPHLLRGFYFRPEINFAAYGADFSSNSTSEYDQYGYPINTVTNYKRESVVAGAFIMTVGAQTVMNNSFLIDGYLGLGYGGNNQSSGGNYNYRFMTGSSDFPLAFTWGLKMGFLGK